MSAPSERYDAPPERPVARCTECNDKGARGGNTVFGCACLGPRVKHLEAELASVLRRLAVLESPAGDVS